MAQNFLYMFEFVVDDLLITHPNECAPDEYITCCELTFRSSVFVNICDPEFGGCLDICTPTKSGKCCLFGLETPITKDDKLFVHIYKKKIEKCKFLLGTTEVPVKNIFEKTTADFLEDNPCLVAYEKQLNKVPSETLSKKSSTNGNKNGNGNGNGNKNVYDSSGNNDKVPRTEEFCPSSTIEKKLLSLFDLKGKQTGNLVLIIRLSCMGPTIVSPFPFCKSNKYKPCPKPPTECCDQSSRNCQYTPRCKPCPCPPQPCCPPRPPPPCGNCPPSCPPTYPAAPRCPPPRKCCPGVCPGDEEEEEGECEGECSECSEAPCYYPCVICPTPKPPTVDEYDEFEANLNGSGMVIRVLKNSHSIQNVVDSDYESDGDECCGGKKENTSDSQPCCNKSFQKSNFLATSFKKNTGGKYLNEKDLPKIRGNVKYPSNELCQNFELPMPIIKECDGSNDKIDKYRKCCPENRNICMQVIGPDIDKALKGINTTNKNGIEICHEKCQETDSDVFILKLGKKQKCKNKKNVIEIELKTPKCPVIINRPKCTRESQIDEAELDAELRNICGKKKKGKKK